MLCIGKFSWEIVPLGKKRILENLSSISKVGYFTPKRNHVKGNTHYFFFARWNPKKESFLILPSSIASTNRARSLKNCQNGTFWPVHGFFFGPNDFIWGAIKVPFFDFIQKMSQAPSSSGQVLIWEDKLDYLNNPSQDFKNFFCLCFFWIFSNAGRQN